MTGLIRLTPAGLLLLLAACSVSPPDLQPASLPGATSDGRRASAEPGGSPDERSARSVLPAPSSGKPSEVFAEARRSYESGNLSSAASLVEEVVKAQPTNREALFMLAVVNQERAADLDFARRGPAYQRSAWAMRQIRANFKQPSELEREILPTVFYNEGVSLAAEGKPEPALKALGEAVDAGFVNIDKLRTEAALEPIRKLAPYHDLLDRVEGMVKKQTEERVQSILAAKPDFSLDFTLPALDDRKVSSADYRGKVLIADLWGTWCPPCRREIPHFIDLYKKYHDKGLEIVGINYEQVAEGQDPKPTIASFVKDNGIPYPCLIGDDKTKAQIKGFQGFPTTLYLDRAGKVRGMVVGFNPEDPVDSRAMEALVKTLLDEPAGGESK